MVGEGLPSPIGTHVYRGGEGEVEEEGGGEGGGGGEGEGGRRGGEVLYKNLEGRKEKDVECRMRQSRRQKGRERRGRRPKSRSRCGFRGNFRRPPAPLTQPRRRSTLGTTRSSPGALTNTRRRREGKPPRGRNHLLLLLILLARRRLKNAVSKQKGASSKLCRKKGKATPTHFQLCDR
jgi:hypothetical protein